MSSTLDTVLRSKKVGVVLHKTSPSAECIESTCMRQCIQKLGYTCDVISDMTYAEPGFSYAAYHTVITCTGILKLHADKFREHGTAIVDFIHADKLTEPQELLGNKDCTDFTWLMNGSEFAADYIETLVGRHVFPVPKLWVPTLDDARYNELAHTAPKLEIVLIDSLDKGGVKWLPVVITERLNQEYPGCIHAVHVFTPVSTEKLSIHPKIKTHSSMSLKDVLCTFNSSKNKVVFLSHQQQPSALQNMHLEIVSQGYALVHNSASLQCGYYYKDADVLGGVKSIVKAAETHDAIIDTYRQAVSGMVSKYHPDHHGMAFNQLIKHQVNIGIQKKTEIPVKPKVIRPLEMTAPVIRKVTTQGIQYIPIVRKVSTPVEPATVQPAVEPKAVEPKAVEAVEPKAVEAVEAVEPKVAEADKHSPADEDFILVVKRSRRKPKSSRGK